MSSSTTPGRLIRDLHTRAASPAAIATANAGFAGNDPAKVVEFTKHAIDSAKDMHSLIDTISTYYRGIIGPSLRSMLDVSSKLVTARKTLAGYIENRTAGTFPSFIDGMHNPFKSIQPAKEAKDALSKDLKEANSWFALQKAEALDRTISMKEAEIEYLDGLCAPPAMAKKLVKLLDDDWEQLKLDLGKHTEKGKAPEETGEIGKAIPFFFKDDLAVAKGLVPYWVRKVWEFTRNKTRKSQELVKGKKDLAEKADETMPDAPDMVQLAKDALQTAMKDLDLQSRNQTGPVCSLNILNSHSIVTNSSTGKRKTAEQEEGRLCEISPERQERSAKRPRPQTSAKEVRECWHHYEQASPRCKWCQLWAAEETRKEKIVRSSKWNLSKPSSLPKQILDLPTELAISFIQSRIKLTQVVKADFRVKLGPGVLSIPENIDNFLCLGHRFLLPSVFSVTLPLESYAALARRVKWIVYFCYQNKDSSFLDEHPQFRIRKEQTTAVPDTTPIWVLAMLEKGRLELLRQVGAIPSTTVNATVVPDYKSELSQLRTWRKQNQFLVLQSDKNLGTTVVSSEWYCKKLDDLVLNDRDFLPITEEVYLGMIEQAGNEIRSYRNNNLPSEIMDYILANLTLDKARINVPKFHGLPKVHKQPWALRPIVPCHSYPLANASKVLSMILKLRVRESPWILESTQDLARELETLKLPSHKKYWLATGDVTAMYPNIPRQRAHQILGEIMKEVDPEDPSLSDLVTKLASWSDNFLVFKHNNAYFHQREGLAMGIPAAPDVANLYMSFFENKFAGNREFLLYKRYIDDIFVVVEAPSSEAAEKILKTVIKADGLEFTWSWDKKTINFLDLSITQEAGKYFSFKPYRKPMNSYERLPFTSYHPVLVKRAAFCGEISRMARLCSNHNDYYKEVAYVRDIYLLRGYPSALLNSWITTESRKRWESRYQDAPEAIGGSSLWLKSEYNTVWKHIDLHKVWASMVDGRDIEKSPLGLIRDIKLSLSRFRNMGEINNGFNAHILQGLHVEENDRIVNDEPSAVELPRQDHPQVVQFGRNPQLRLNFPRKN